MSMAVEHLAFESGKEALAESIVVAIADRAHRWADPSFSTALTEGQRGVLTALVGVMDDAFRTAFVADWSIHGFEVPG